MKLLILGGILLGVSACSASTEYSASPMDEYTSYERAQLTHFLETMDTEDDL